MHENPGDAMTAPAGIDAELQRNIVEAAVAWAMWYHHPRFELERRSALLAAADALLAHRS